MFERDWTTSSHFINYSAPNSKHIWEDLCMYVVSEGIKKHALLGTIRVVQILIWFSLMFHHRFDNVTQI